MRQVLLWHLDYFDHQGMASEYGQELGVYDEGEEPVVAEEDESVQYVVGKTVTEESDIESIDVFLVLDLQMQYLQQIGAIGHEVSD